MGAMTTRVIIADDHPLVREGTRNLLARHDDIDVVGEAADGDTAVRLVLEQRPDIAILDLGMPGTNGIEATRRIKASCPEVAVLVLTVHDEDAYVTAAIEAGAAGYLLKDAHGDEVVGAVRAIAGGESVLHPAVTRRVLARLRGGPDGRDPASLTEREFDVLRLAASGGSNQAIASELGLSARTVQVHLRSVFAKLEVATRTEAVVVALKHGLLSLDELP